jgi:hypothetical protein
MLTSYLFQVCPALCEASERLGLWPWDQLRDSAGDELRTGLGSGVGRPGGDGSGVPCAQCQEGVRESSLGF